MPFLPLLIYFIQSRECRDVSPSEMVCLDDGHCKLGENITHNCYAFPSTNCTGERDFKLIFPCRYCYQLSSDEMVCQMKEKCQKQLTPVIATCYASSNCVGNSIFDKQTRCKSESKSQKTAVLLSLFLGGVAADRFYLGYYVEGVFKLLTIGGLGIAYTIDLILIITGCLGPADGTLYSERI